MSAKAGYKRVNVISEKVGRSQVNLPNMLKLELSFVFD